MNGYLKALFTFSKNFTDNLTDHFIQDLKNLINEQYSNEVKREYEYLYSGSNNMLYFPKNNISNFNKKSILLVSHELSRTGAPVVILDTAKILVKNGYFVTVVSPINGPLLDEFLHYGVPVIISHELYLVQNRLEGIEYFQDHFDLDIFVKKFDVTLFNTATLYNLIKRYMNIKQRIIWWIHEGSDTYKGIGERIPKYLSSNIDVYCVGNYAKEQLQKYDFHYSPKILLYGVEDVNENGMIKNPKNNKVRFLIVGTICERKGQLTVIKAIKELPINYLNKVEFIFIGDVAKDDIFGDKVKQILIETQKSMENIKIFPAFKREDLFEFYKTIDCLIVPSTDDPMPVVATECLMLNKICICSNKTGTSYLIDNTKNGFVFDNQEIDDLKNKIIYILDNIQNLNDIKMAGRKIYEQYFEMSIFEKNLLSIIENKD